ncbi:MULTISPECIES: sensor histidine kinase [Bacteroides]|jgi:signal transduction histidine kinase|uniref:histidine kinase n=4 Tax=Bacteroides TaxID=816 RepID=A0AB38UCT1_BACT4|nr:MULTISPECIES: ATP-binding protein [Bacteroides]EFI05118.1 two-component system sensor histidine kinase [Bacteroides sp. 1_1_14]MBL3924266.1 two-component sensor histidine kinase [Bacteroides thetaiotaomicron]MBL3938090.1 two-component sensor histidine kinase [Bacteroides thetaiotaomicron]MBU9881001.1 two-component sensor histidine kinase [Bacteroides sp. MSK.20.82]MCA6010119.1 two-component sensor histidine kinase [Bacteroides thetaiotaomicron]
MEARITRKTAALAIFLISAFQTYIYAGRPSSCQLLIINSYTENCLWSDDFMAPVYKEFRVQNSPVDICAEHMELMATVVPDMRKQVFMSDRRWISAQCRKEAEEVMPFLLIGGYFWTDSEIKKHLLPVIKSRLDGASHPHRVETTAMGTPPSVINYADYVESGLLLGLCPDDTVFGMKPPTFFERNKYYLALFFSLMALAVIYVIWLRRALHERSRRLEIMRSYSSLVENMPVLYARVELIFDPGARIIDYVYREVNPTFEKYILPKEKILGKKYSELNPDYSPELPDRYSELNDNRQITFQYYLEKTKTHLTVISIHSKTKGCVDVFGVDNTELVLTQQMLKSTNHKLSAALDAADMTPWKWDLRTGLLSCNVSHDLYVTEEEVTHDGNLIIVPTSACFAKICDEDRERVRDAFERLANGETQKMREEYRVGRQWLPSPQQNEWVEVRAAVDERDANGKPLSLIGTSMTVTQRKEMEEALVQAKVKAEEANTLKSSFLANISHEIRTPLNAIVGFSSLLVSAERGISEEKQEYINIIENNNTLLLQLISDVLDLSKIEAGTMEFDYAPVDVHGLFIELEDTFRLRNKKSGICICYHRRTTECVVKADRNRLVQVMMNLMNNAVKFTGEGSIEFGFDVREDGFLHFYVTDTGCGIPEERLEEIFGNFVKLNSFVQGTGLGLTICRAIVERMGGKIGAVSRLGQGSTFWFTLPYTANEEKV